jgi:hypothetical protein
VPDPALLTSDYYRYFNGGQFVDTQNTLIVSESSFPLPASGPFAITSNIDMFTTMDLNGTSPAPVLLVGTMDIQSAGPGGALDYFDMEITSMNLTGVAAFGPVSIRESPTLHSLGKTTITPIGGNVYQIDSFFDVFTELSLDDGQTWIPNTLSASERFVGIGTPEPASLALLGIGMTHLALRRRRSR